MALLKKTKAKKTVRKRKGTIEEQATRDRCNQLRALLRRAWSRDARRYQCLADSRRPYNGPSKQQKWEQQCAVCAKWFKASEVQVDHVTPCGSFLELTPECLGQFAYNMFENPLQTICKPCHKIKTAEERKK